MSKLKVYALREFGRSVWLPSDILAALGEPPNHRQGQLLIWATTARAAYQHAENCGLGGAVRSSRELGLAMGFDVGTLDAACPWPDGTILATNSSGTGPVVEITRQAGDRENDKRRVRVIGHLERPDRSIFIPVDVSIVVTDDMLTAARQAIPDFEAYMFIGDDGMRAAIAAALAARKGQS